MRKREMILVALIGIVPASEDFLAQPTVLSGYSVEAYVTGLQNVNAIAFSPGGTLVSKANCSWAMPGPIPGRSIECQIGTTR